MLIFAKSAQCVNCFFKTKYYFANGMRAKNRFNFTIVPIIICFKRMFVHFGYLHLAQSTIYQKFYGAMHVFIYFCLHFAWIWCPEHKMMYVDVWTHFENIILNYWVAKRPKRIKRFENDLNEFIAGNKSKFIS